MADENRRTRKQLAEETLKQAQIGNEYLREIAQHLTMLRHLSAELCAGLNNLRSMMEQQTGQEHSEAVEHTPSAAEHERLKC